MGNHYFIRTQPTALLEYLDIHKGFFNTCTSPFIFEESTKERYTHSVVPKYDSSLVFLHATMLQVHKLKFQRGLQEPQKTPSTYLAGVD